MTKFGLFVIDKDDASVKLLAIYDCTSECRKNIPNDKQFYTIIPIITSYEREDFELGKGAEPVKSFK